jgi:hypothetical protein
VTGDRKIEEREDGAVREERAIKKRIKNDFLIEKNVQKNLYIESRG